MMKGMINMICLFFYCYELKTQEGTSSHRQRWKIDVSSTHSTDKIFN